MTIDTVTSIQDFGLSPGERKRHICFRDRLLGSTAMAAQYAELKLASLSEASGSRDLYQTLKSPFIVEAQCSAAGPDSAYGARTLV